MKVLLVLLLCTFGLVQSQFGLFNLVNSFLPQPGGGGSGGYDLRYRALSCPLHRCRNVDKIDYLRKRNLSANFPYHHLQHLRRKSTHYTLLGSNVEFRAALNNLLNRPGAFLVYDSWYDPIYDPCTDCDGSGYGGEYCTWGRCYIHRTFIVGKN